MSRGMNTCWVGCLNAWCCWTFTCGLAAGMTVGVGTMGISSGAGGGATTGWSNMTLLWSITTKGLFVGGTSRCSTGSNGTWVPKGMKVGCWSPSVQLMPSNPTSIRIFHGCHTCWERSINCFVVILCSQCYATSKQSTLYTFTCYFRHDDSLASPSSSPRLIFFRAHIDAYQPVERTMWEPTFYHNELLTCIIVAISAFLFTCIHNSSCLLFFFFFASFLWA